MRPSLVVVLLMVGCTSMSLAATISVDETKANMSGTVANLFANITPTSGDFIFCDVTYNTAGVATGGGVSPGGTGCVLGISDVLRFTAALNANGLLI